MLLDVGEAVRVENSPMSTSEGNFASWPNTATKGSGTCHDLRHLPSLQVPELSATAGTPLACAPQTPVRPPTFRSAGRTWGLATTRTSTSTHSLPVLCSTRANRPSSGLYIVTTQTGIPNQLSFTHSRDQVERQRTEFTTDYHDIPIMAEEILDQIRDVVDGQIVGDARRHPGHELPSWHELCLGIKLSFANRGFLSLGL